MPGEAMKLLVLSDLHLEFRSFRPPAEGYDAVILAGDILPGVKVVRWAARPATFGGAPVLLVPGNHEFYGSERNLVLSLMRDAAEGTPVRVLDRDELQLSGVRFSAPRSGQTSR